MVSGRCKMASMIYSVMDVCSFINLKDVCIGTITD